MGKRLVFLVCFLYVAFVIYYNTSDFFSVNQATETMLVNIKNANDELYLDDLSNSEFVEKCTELKQLALNLKEKVSKTEEITDSEALEKIILEDIEFLTQDINFDVTIDDEGKVIISERVLELNELLKNIDEDNFYEISKEYEQGRVEFIEKYRLKNHSLM